MVNSVSGTVVGNVVMAGSVSITARSEPAPTALAGLPPQPVFVGRTAEVGALLDVLRPAADSNVPVSAVGGLGGIGKTALIVHAARQAVANEWFPGGVLMIDMRGYDRTERQLTALSALGSLLTSLGLRGEQIPEDLGARSRLWRSVLAAHGGQDQHVLVLIDNVSHADQVLPLLPGDRWHRVLITCRHSLSGLQGVRLLDLDVLPDDSATTLLATELTTARVGDERVAADPVAARRLVELCGGLPLALCTAIALLKSDARQPLAELVTDLEDEQHRLEGLHVDDDLSVRAAFNLSYQRLPYEQARAFRLLALNPGPEFGTEAVAELVNQARAEAKWVLKRLARAYLIIEGSDRDRWRMHDLLRLYAAELVARDDERPAAVCRLLQHYRAVTVEAASELDPRIPPGRRARRFQSRGDAVAWLDNECANLLASIALARQEGLTGHQFDIAIALEPYFELRRVTGDWITAADAALEAACLLGDPAAEAAASAFLGGALLAARQPDEALDHQLRALALFRRLRDRHGEGRVLSNLGNIQRIQGRITDAMEQLEASLVIRRELEDRVGEARTLTNLGLAHQEQGRKVEAIRVFQQALRIFDELSEQRGWALVLHRLADVYRGDGQVRMAEMLYRRVVFVLRRQDDRRGAAEALHGLGELLLTTGRADEGRNCQAEAAQLAMTAGLGATDVLQSSPIMNTSLHTRIAQVRSLSEMRFDRLGFFDKDNRSGW